MGSLEPVYIISKIYIWAQNWNQLEQSNIQHLKMYHWEGDWTSPLPE